MSSLKSLFRALSSRPWLADWLALTGAVVFLSNLWIYAHNQYSVLDEGLYLYKGWLLALGRYTPFQDYGIWMNQMPLSFFIPGWIEVLLGPGLRTGRMFTLVLNALAILGWWLTARRLGNHWTAAGIVWAMALNPAAGRMLSMAASQGLINCLLAWTMFLSLGADRKNWQLFLGGLLAGTVVMVRINLLPLLPLLAFYTLWEGASHRQGGIWPFKGKSQSTKASSDKNGATHSLTPFLWSLAGMVLVFGGVHLAYWPNILRLWARWLPLPFLQPWFPPKNLPTWQPDNFLAFRVASFFLAFRFHFLAMTGAVIAWILWPEKDQLRVYKAAVFLSILLFAFILLHAWAALGNEYCVFCFPTYTTFYSGIGLLLIAITAPSWNLNPPAGRKWLGLLVMFVMLGGMAYSAEGAAEGMLGEKFYRRLLTLPMPGFGGAQIWQVLANKFQMAERVVFDGVHAWFPVVLSVGIGLVLLAAGKLLVGRKNSEALGVGLVLFTLIGSLLAPIPVLTGEYRAYDCDNAVIAGYEAVGAQLAQTIPAGSKVYWAGYSPVTLLYLPGVEILPGQLHGVYSFRVSDDDEALRRYGWWNQSLAEKWLAEADYVLVEQRNLGRDDWLNAQLANFEPILVTTPQSCLPESALTVYRKK